MNTRTPKRPAWRGLPALLAFAAFVAIAQGLHALGALPKTVPAPSTIVHTAIADASLILDHAQATLAAAALGYVIAVSLSLVLIGAVAFIPAIRGFVYNLAVVLHTLPLLVLAPILVIWFGLGIETRVIIAALASYYAVLIAGLHGLTASSGRIGELMHVLDASKAQRIRLVVVPFALPALFAGLKIGATGSVLGAVISEWTGAERGLGLLMSYSLFSFHVERVWLTMFATMLLAIGAYALVALAERRLLRWHRATTAVSPA